MIIEYIRFVLILLSCILGFIALFIVIKDHYK